MSPNAVNFEISAVAAVAIEVGERAQLQWRLDRDVATHYGADQPPMQKIFACIDRYRPAEARAGVAVGIDVFRIVMLSPAAR